MIGAFFLAALAAVANATSSLLQRQANRRPAHHPLFVRPVWLLGIGAALVSFVLQAGALGIGSLAAVEPVLALELALVVLGSGLFFKTHIGKQEWFSIAMMSAGTIGLIMALDPRQKDHVIISPAQWTIALVASFAVIGGCALGSLLIRRHEYRAALLGVGTGLAMGLASSLLKAIMLVVKQQGALAALTAWQFYLAVAVGIFSFWLLQMAFRTGKLIASQPGITLADPVVAIIWGGLVYAEKMNGGLAILVAVVMMALLAAGAIVLARAPALEKRE